MTVIDILALAQLAQVGIERYKCILRTEVERVVDAPIHLPDLPRGVEEALQDVAEQDAWPKRDAHRLNGLHDGADDVWRGLEAVRPDEVHEVEHCVLAVEASNAEGEVLNDDAGRLTMDKVAVREGVLEHRDHRVDVVRGLWADVLEDECKGLQTARADVELGGTVLVEDCGDTRER